MIGYNPCGAIVEWGRERYDTGCRFFRDSDRIDGIRWYPALPGAVCLPYPSAIHQSIWDRDPDQIIEYHDGVGEVYDSPRVISHMTPVAGADGSHQCGTEEDFKVGAHYDPDVPPVPMRPDGLPVCCLPEPAGYLWGGWIVYPQGGYLWGAFAATMPTIPTSCAMFRPPEEFDRLYQRLELVLVSGGTGVLRSDILAPGTVVHCRFRALSSFPAVTVSIFHGTDCGSLVPLFFGALPSGCVEVTIPTAAFVLFAAEVHSDTGWYLEMEFGLGPC